MFDIKIFQNEKELETIKNLTYTQKEAIERVLARITDRVEGFRFVPEHIEIRSNSSAVEKFPIYTSIKKRVFV